MKLYCFWTGAGSSVGHCPVLSRLSGCSQPPWPSLPAAALCCVDVLRDCATGTLAPTSTDDRTSSEQIKELCYSEAAFTDYIQSYQLALPFAVSHGGNRALLSDPGRPGNSAAGPCQLISGTELSICFSTVYSDLFRVYMHIHYICSSHQCLVDLILH